MEGVNSHLATALRTIVVALFGWAMVWVAGSSGAVGALELRSWLFLILSGLATGGSWLCYFRALQLGEVNQVAPVDKSSTVLTLSLIHICCGGTDRVQAGRGDPATEQGAQCKPAQKGDQGK